MPPRWNENRLTAKLGIDYPVIQGPLGGLSSQKSTAAVSNFGGLGSFGAHGLTPEAIKEAIAEIRSLTSKPFAMNLWVSMEDEGARTSDENAFNRSLAPLTSHLAGLGAPHPTFKPYSPARFEDQARVLLDAKVPVFSFIFGIPPREVLEECRAKSIVTIGTATTPDEGAALEEAGVDVIVASGFEAGGHRGSFLRAAENSLTGTLALVPQIVDNVDVPVIAAGGIGDVRGVVAALALGAEGVQMGTVFLACEESGASLLHRQAKVVVITGASSGIGESTAKLLAEQGARVVLGARRSNRINEVVQEILATGGKAIGFATDVTKRAEVEALIQGAVDGFGRVDVLINNAGIMPIAPIEALKVRAPDMVGRKPVRFLLRDRGVRPDTAF